MRFNRFMEFIENIVTWLPLAALFTAAMMAKGFIPAWALTWVLILFLIFGFKWVFFWPYFVQARKKIAFWRIPFFFFLWVGLDPENFLNPEYKASRPSLRMWFYPLSNLILSLFLFAVLPRFIPLEHPWLLGWSAMMGMLIFVYFVLTHALALMWQSFGIDAKHLMQKPILAKTLSRFWHFTWNTAYHRLIYNFVYKPTHAWAGKTGSLFLSFLASGILHEIVFSFPYNAGYGLPTTFFMIQAMGISLERSPWGRKLKMRNHKIGGRIYIYAFTIPTSMLLFHLPLIRGGTLPFLHALNILP